MRKRGSTQRKAPKRAPLAGLAVAAARRRLSPIARAAATVLEHRSRSNPQLRVVMIGYGARARVGLAEETKHTRRSCMRGVKELEQAGLIAVDGPTRENSAYRGRRRWFQRLGGRVEGGAGRANEYGPGPELGGGTPAPRAQPADDGQSPFTDTDEWLLQRMLKRKAEHAEARGPSPGG